MNYIVKRRIVGATDPPPASVDQPHPFDIGNPINPLALVIIMKSQDESWSPKSAGDKAGVRE